MLKGQIVFYDNNNKCEKYGLNRNDFFNEDLIIEISMNKFNDNEPCIIKRTGIFFLIAKEIVDTFSYSDFKDALTLKDFINKTNNYFDKDKLKEFMEKEGFVKIRII